MRRRYALQPWPRPSVVFLLLQCFRFQQQCGAEGNEENKGGERVGGERVRERGEGARVCNSGR